MPSTVGHALCGLACYVALRRFKPELIADAPRRGILWFLFLANLPDIDMLIGYLFASNYLVYHWGFTHTLAFSLIAGVFASYLAKLAGLMQLRSWWIFALVIASHVLLDLLTGPNWGLNFSYGLKVLWPLWDEKISLPFSLFLGVHHGADNLFNMHNFYSILIEFAILLPIVLAIAVIPGKQWMRYGYRT